MDPHYGRIDFWTEVAEVRGPVVAYELHYRFGAEEIVAPGTLRWRTGAELTASLTEAGFTVAHTYGSWDHHPTGPELIIVAQREEPLLPHS